jgi:hypothetical protein
MDVIHRFVIGEARYGKHVGIRIWSDELCPRLHSTRQQRQ